MFEDQHMWWLKWTWVNRINGNARKRCIYVHTSVRAVAIRSEDISEQMNHSIDILPDRCIGQFHWLSHLVESIHCDERAVAMHRFSLVEENLVVSFLPYESHAPYSDRTASFPTTVRFLGKLESILCPPVRNLRGRRRRWYLGNRTVRHWEIRSSKRPANHSRPLVRSKAFDRRCNDHCVTYVCISTWQMSIDLRKYIRTWLYHF